MNNISIEIITNPLYALACLLVFCTILYVFFFLLFNPSKVFWARLELVWITIGFLGVFSLVTENKRQFLTVQKEREEFWLKVSYDNLFNFTNRSFHCPTFVKDSYLTQIEFDSVVQRQSKICEWVNRIKRDLKDSASRQLLPIELPVLDIVNTEKEFSYQVVQTESEQINNSILAIKEMSKEIEDNFWNDFKNSMGVLLIIFAFAIRIQIVINKVKEARQQSNTTNMGD